MGFTTTPTILGSTRLLCYKIYVLHKDSIELKMQLQLIRSYLHSARQTDLKYERVFFQLRDPGRRGGRIDRNSRILGIGSGRGLIRLFGF